MDFGKAIKNIRKQKGFTQKQLADLCEISVTTLSQIETNDTFPHKSNLKKIALALDVPNTYLFFMALETDDVPAEKRILYKTINNLIQEMLVD